MKRSNQIQRCGLFVFLVWTLFACQVKRPETVLSDKQMEDVLYDYHIAKALGEALSYNENYKRVLYVESVYKKYGITEAQFDSSMVWYARNPEVLSKIYENINARLKAEKQLLRICWLCVKVSLKLQLPVIVWMSGLDRNFIGCQGCR